MGTRGSWGFIVGGKRWETYNHYDSYPSALGEDLLAWAQSVQERGQWDTVKARVLSLTVVDQETEPSAEVLSGLVKAGIADVGVSTGKDWYAALRRCQGNPSVTLNSRFWLDGDGFHLDALFCEWAYVFDLDRAVFVVTEGRSVDEGGLAPEAATYTAGSGKGYGQVVTAEVPFADLPLAALLDDGTVVLIAAVRSEAPAALDA